MACDWKRIKDGTWKSQCGVFYTTYLDTPQESGITFCPHCGKPVRVEVEPELKPCPFCGKTDTLKALSESVIQEKAPTSCDSFAVVCDAQCGGCGATGGYARFKDKAIEQWNKRSSTVAFPEWPLDK